MNVSLEILKKLSDYIAGQLNLQSFRDWEVGLFLNSAELEQDDKQFLAAFEGHYAELSDGLIVEQQFKQLLSALVIPQQASTSQSGVQVLFYGTTVPDTYKIFPKSAYQTNNAGVVFIEPEYSHA